MWRRANAGGAAAARESRATTSSRSARPGGRKSEGCGGGWERTAGGSTQGHRRYGSCGEETTEAVLEFLRDTRVGCWTAYRGAGGPAEEAGQGDWGGKREARARLRDVILSFSRGAGDCLWSGNMYRRFCTDSFPLFLFLFPLFSYLPFHLVRGGAVDWGVGERGAPV